MDVTLSPVTFQNLSSPFWSNPYSHISPHSSSFYLNRTISSNNNQRCRFFHKPERQHIDTIRYLLIEYIAVLLRIYPLLTLSSPSRITISNECVLRSNKQNISRIIRNNLPSTKRRDLLINIQVLYPTPHHITQLSSLLWFKRFLRMWIMHKYLSTNCSTYQIRMSPINYPHVPTTNRLCKLHLASVTSPSSICWLNEKSNAGLSINFFQFK